MINYGYISISFTDNDVKSISILVDDICNKDKLYYSPVINYIQGKVSGKLHLTIFYGLINNKVDKYSLNEYIKNIKLKHLMLGRIYLKWGYNNLYKILCIEVLDDNGELKLIYDGFKDFDYERSVQHEFDPHLTLAYVKPDFGLKYSHMPFQKMLKVKEICYFEN
jgi:hypothetical protein